MAVIDVLPAKLMPVAAVPPKMTEGTAAKSVPRMVTVVPPEVLPPLGVTLVTVGAAEKVKPAARVPL